MAWHVSQRLEGTHLVATGSGPKRARDLGRGTLLIERLTSRERNKILPPILGAAYRGCVCQSQNAATRCASRCSPLEGNLSTRARVHPGLLAAANSIRYSVVVFVAGGFDRSPTFWVDFATQPFSPRKMDEVHVGRVRQDISRPDKKGLDMFICGDQIRKGAAQNAVQVAELLLCDLLGAEVYAAVMTRRTIVGWLGHRRRARFQMAVVVRDMASTRQEEGCSASAQEALLQWSLCDCSCHHQLDRLNA
eukprot:1179686-Prorocentrum_minimum.AAC.1